MIRPGDSFNALHRWVARAEWERPLLDAVGNLTMVPRVPSMIDESPAPLSPERRALVSVVIPCFNYGRFLPGAVASALDQPGIDVEVVVVDDRSTDDSLAVARSLAAVDDRVVVVEQAENLGHVRTFNAGLARATGDFVVRLDADDLLTPGSLTRAVALFERNPGVGLVYGYARHFEEDDVPVPREGSVSWTVWRGHDWIARRCARGTNCITTPEAVVRSSVLRDVGGLNTRLRFAQDMEMWLRVAAVSDVGRVNDVDQALHRDHTLSMSVNEGNGVLTDLQERRTVFEELFSAVGDRIDGAEGLHARARRALAREALGHASYAYDRRRREPGIEARLVDFATDTDPAVTSTLAWRAYAVRARVGPDLLRRDPLAIVRVARVRARDELAYLQWTRTGL